MAIEKVVTYDYETVGDYSIQVRRRDSYVEDGVALSWTFHRHVVHPNSDWSSESDEIKAICDALFTDEVQAAYLAEPDIINTPEKVEEYCVKYNAMNEASGGHAVK